MTDGGFVSYPRTQHLEGSRLQAGDVDDGLKLSRLPAGLQVWEEKLDGANTGVSFDGGVLKLQSRGHFLAGGARERQFGPLKAWAAENETELYEALGDRYVAFQEWCFAVHSVFYDRLPGPSYGFEMDIWDKEEGVFLSTACRHALIAGSCLTPVPVLHEGPLRTQKEIKALIKRPLFQSEDWREAFIAAAEAAGTDPEKALASIDGSGLAEGLYLKVEDPERGVVVGRYKWIRQTFLQTILDSGKHWSARPLIRNQVVDERPALTLG